MRTSLRIAGATVVAAAAAVSVPLLSSPSAQAAGFTGGNLVVYRVGTSGGTLTNAAAPVFLDTFGPTGTALGSTALPTAAADGNLPLTAAGQSRSEGLITRSPDGRYVTLTGYAAAPGATGPNGYSLTATDPATVKRVVGIVDGHGGVDTSTALTGSAAPAIIRSAATTNGDDLLVAGGSGGIQKATLGGTASSVVAGTAASNLNQLTVVGGTLFASGILTDRLAAVSGSTLTDVPGLPDNLLTYGYAALDLTPSVGWNKTPVDTLYLANASERGGTVDKYRFNGTTWSKAGDVDVAGATGLVANVTSGSVSLAVTTPTQLLTLTDPAGPASSFAPSAVTTLATAAAGTEFRGVALAPTAATGPSVFLRTPTRGSSVSAAGSIPVTAYVPGSPTSVTVSIGSSSKTTATKDAGHLWTANVPGTGIAAGTQTVTVTATDATGSTTVTRPVTVTGSTVPAGALAAGRYAPSDPRVHRKGTWKAYATTASPSGKGLSASKKKSALTATVYGRKLVVALTTGPKNGTVTITVDGLATTVDLYAKKAKTLTRSFSLGAVKAHRVSITVTGKKSATSKGTGVQVAALTVS